MDERIRFHLDESVDPDVALALRGYGIDITTTFEVGMRGQPDAAQMAHVQREHRVLITHDSDFLRFAGQERNHPGIVYCERLRRSLGDIIRGVVLIYEVLTPVEMVGRVEYL